MQHLVNSRAKLVCLFFNSLKILLSMYASDHFNHAQEITKAVSHWKEKVKRKKIAKARQASKQLYLLTILLF